MYSSPVSIFLRTIGLLSSILNDVVGEKLRNFVVYAKKSMTQSSRNEKLLFPPGIDVSNESRRNASN